MPVNIDHAAARQALEKAWIEIGSESRPSVRMRQAIESVLGASDVTFKYILVTGYLAKYLNAAAHARALQVGSSLAGAYDARSLCHKVVVGFEKSKGNLFGLSNEPFVNKPARHPEHDKNNLQLRNKVIASHLHDALELAQSANNEEVFRGLVHILRIGAVHSANEKHVVVHAAVNMNNVFAFVNEFLKETDGGCRLVAIWGAFQILLSKDGEIKVYSPNASDYFSKTSGDVEVYCNGLLVSASECKQRPLSLDDVNHGIKKAIEKGVPEYFFVISAGILEGQESAILATLKSHNSEVDLSLVDIWKRARFLTAMLGPVSRAKFGEVVVDLLRRMRKFESANIAAELWNKITS